MHAPDSGTESGAVQFDPWWCNDGSEWISGMHQQRRKSNCDWAIVVGGGFSNRWLQWRRRYMRCYHMWDLGFVCSVRYHHIWEMQRTRSSFCGRSLGRWQGGVWRSLYQGCADVVVGYINSADEWTGSQGVCKSVNPMGSLSLVARRSLFMEVFVAGAIQP
ncbi:hypothetical protein NE237_008235 [Protea cynaroides]|uniref:Uncharacterized protein n=1 Tax=Protea cynaroides TaxID=273540 RepID=A0A9Q0KRJ0_9MAGN|nr:hypothetical protein NE237_008235 [Protea cynaroides]